MPHSRSSSPEQSPRRSRSRDRETKKPCSLLVRQLDYKVKAEEVKQFYEKFGPVKDVYLPSDFYTRKPRGFGFVEFENEKDARAAMDQTDGTDVLGSTVKVVFAREGRKAPGDMKRREEHYRRRRSHSRDRCRRHSRSRSPPRHRRRSRSHSSDKSYSRSHSPRRRRRSSSSESRKRSP